ncbi:MAG: glycosyltransferase family 39 protein [Planctomycetia bacterium]|nr:glycosyltransferase family 39 protein [Planctomycetia bacterium]
MASPERAAAESSSVPVRGPKAPWFVLAAAAVLFFWQLGARPLYAPDEGRYALSGREMLESGDWLVPTLTGIPYLDKPPMMFWSSAAGMAIFGKNEFGARFFIALVALAGVWLAWVLGKEAGGADAGVVTAAVTASSALYVVLARVILTDMLLSVAILGAYAGFLRAWNGRPGALGMWVALAFAFLSKGPVGPALFAFGAVPCWWLSKRRPPLRSFRPLLGPVVWAVFALPWTVYLCATIPTYFEFFYWRENIQALTSKSIHHGKPWFYALYGAFGGFVPWTLLLPFGVVAAWREVRRRGREADPAVLLCVLWACTTMAIFTASSSKLPTYFLPMMPPMAVLVARSLCAHDGPRRATAWVLGVLAAGAPVGAVIGLFADRRGHATWWIPAAAVVGAVGFAFAARLLARGRVPAAFQAALAGLALAVFPGAFAIRAFDEDRAPASILARNESLLRSSDAVVNCGDRVALVEWSLRLPVTYVGNPHDFVSGRDLAPGRGSFLDLDDLPQFRRAHPRITILADERNRDEIQRDFPGFREIASDKGHVLFVSPETP